MSSLPIRIVGAPGSPYSRKMRALVRYRRIPHRFIVRNSRADRDLPPVPVALIPIVVFPGDGAAPDEAMVDSTFQIRRLEELWSERSVVPPDPAMAFVDFLIEDFADEWLTKAMFHYRWAYQSDIDKAAAILPRWRAMTRPPERIAELSRQFSTRQIERLGVVGSNEETAPVIEESYRQLLRVLDAHLSSRPFVMGERPGTSDFALYGQLTQLAQFDPTPAAVALERAPNVVAWVDLVEDLSGAEVADDDWATSNAVPEGVRELLHQVGRYYAPFLLANAAALDAGSDRVECVIDGRNWTQPPFPYQRKCLGWLRESRARLAAADRRRVDDLLSGTGCEPLFSD